MVPAVLFEGERCAVVMIDAHDVHQDVDTAHRLVGLRDESSAVLRPADVGHDEVRGTTVGANLVDRGLAA